MQNEPMRAVVQRVASASVEMNGEIVGSCCGGLLLLVGVHRDDTKEDAKRLADRVIGLRIFNDATGKLNLSLSQANELHKRDDLGILAVSNFTVYGDASKSRRPSFMASAKFEAGQELFDLFVNELVRLGASVQVGLYGADMQVSLVNDGPVTLILDTA